MNRNFVAGAGASIYRPLINLMRSLIGDFIKELVRWQITVASMSKKSQLPSSVKARGPVTVSLPGMKQ